MPPRHTGRWGAIHGGGHHRSAVVSSPCSSMYAGLICCPKSSWVCRARSEVLPLRLSGDEWSEKWDWPMCFSGTLVEAPFFTSLFHSRQSGNFDVSVTIAGTIHSHFGTVWRLDNVGKYHKSGLAERIGGLIRHNGEKGTYRPPSASPYRNHLTAERIPTVGVQFGQGHAG